MKLRIRKNTVSDDVAKLTRQGLIRECGEIALTNGRPRVPIEIDPESRHVVGLAIEPGRVVCGRVNLLGQSVGRIQEAVVDDPALLVPEAVRLTRKQIDDATLAVGLTVPGFVDVTKDEVLFSAAWPKAGHVSLSPVRQARLDTPVIIGSLTNAQAIRWLLERSDAPDDDHLLIYLSDGRLGASLIVGGKPVRGCLVGTNELGHTRLPIETSRCYCGHRGCLERICSSAFLRELDGSSPPLAEAVMCGRRSDAVRRMTELLALGLSNAINFCRVGRVTLMTDLPDVEPYLEHLVRQVRKLVLRELADRVDVQLWVDIKPRASITAASLTLAQLFLVELDDRVTPIAGVAL